MTKIYISKKKYKVSTSYTMEIIADNKDEAKELFIELLDTVSSDWVEDQIEVKELKNTA